MKVSRRWLFGWLAVAPLAPLFRATPITDTNTWSRKLNDYWATSKMEVMALAPKGPWVSAAKVRFRREGRA